MNNPPVWQNLKISHRNDGESTRHNNFHTLPIRAQITEPFSKNFCINRYNSNTHILYDPATVCQGTYPKETLVCVYEEKTYKNVHSTLFLRAKAIKTQKPIKLKNG